MATSGKKNETQIYRSALHSLSKKINHQDLVIVRFVAGAVQFSVEKELHPTRQTLLFRLYSPDDLSCLRSVDVLIFIPSLVFETSKNFPVS